MKVSSKKKLLGILTAAAIVVTAVGSFAVWDQLIAEKTSNEITFTKPVETVIQNIEVTPTKEQLDAGKIVVPVTVSSANLVGTKTMDLNVAAVGTAPAGVTFAVGADDSATAATYSDAAFTEAGHTYQVVINVDRNQAVTSWSGTEKAQFKVTATVK